MDPTLLSLLETIPQKPTRSKLETHREIDPPTAAQGLHVSRHRSHFSRTRWP